MSSACETIINDLLHNITCQTITDYSDSATLIAIMEIILIKFNKLTSSFPNLTQVPSYIHPPWICTYHSANSRGCTTNSMNTLSTLGFGHHENKFLARIMTLWESFSNNAYYTPMLNFTLVDTEVFFNTHAT